MRTISLLLTVAGAFSSLSSSSVGQDHNLGNAAKSVTKLIEISPSANGPRATLWDGMGKREIKLRLEGANNHFQLRDIGGTTQVEGTVVHIGRRDVVFRSDGNNYAIHLGQSLLQALEKPLNAEEVAAFQKEKPVQPAPKTYALEMRDAPWSAVFEWLIDQTGMHYVADYFPDGRFTFISPPNKTYTLGEVIDILNDALIPNRFILIRRDQSFTVIPANLGEPIDPSVLPRVKPEDLSQRGVNELVAMAWPLGDLDAGEVMAELKPLVGPFGHMSFQSRNNQLLLQDTAGNLKRVVEALKEFEAKQPAKSAAKTFTLELRDRTWQDVFDWLTEATGMPVVAQAKPTGAFTYVSPAMKANTLPEIIDILNEALMVQKLLLIRRGHSFALVSTDDAIDPALVPRVKVSDLASRGNSELVSLVLPVNQLSPDDVAMEAERVLGPLGRAIPLSKANQVILQDTVGNLKRVIDTVRAMEEKASRRRS